MTDERKQYILEVIETLCGLSFSEVDSGIASVGKEVVDAYKHGLLTDEQKQFFAEYRVDRETKRNREYDSRLMQELRNLKQKFSLDIPNVFQRGVIDGRIVVSAYDTVVDGKETKIKSMGPVFTIYRNRTPDSYDYALLTFPTYESF